MKTETHVYKKSPKETTQSHITVNLLRTNDKEKNLKSSQRKRQNPNRGTGRSSWPVRDAQAKDGGAASLTYGKENTADLLSRVKVK